MIGDFISPSLTSTSAGSSGTTGTFTPTETDSDIQTHITGSLTIPGNTIQMGDVIRIFAAGSATLPDQNNVDKIVFKITLNNLDIFNNDVSWSRPNDNAVSDPTQNPFWTFTALITWKQIGANVNVPYAAFLTLYGTGSAEPSGLRGDGKVDVSTTTFDTTHDLLVSIVVGAEAGAADTTTVTLSHCLVEHLQIS